MISPAFANARFLIVDDEPQNVGVLTQMLRMWGATNILSTTLGAEAVPLTEAYMPDLLLLDLMMPDVDGFMVMEQLPTVVAANDYLPILVLTADTTDVAKKRALKLGAADFLTKPFDATELSLRIQNLLARRLLHLKLVEQNQELDQQVQERTAQLAQAEIDTAECLAMAAEYRDDDTGQHTQRVGQLAAQLAHQLGQDEEVCTLLLRAAPLHDVGKIGIPDSILLKPGKLTPEEFDIIKTHASIGAAIMGRHHTALLQLAALIAASHHEKWNGTGYPLGLTGEEIPLEGRIVAVVDVFDALTHERPYKAAWTLEEAIAEIVRSSGAHFDPNVVEAFLNLMQEQGMTD